MPPKLPDFLSPNPANRTTMRSAPGRRNKSKLAESLNASMNTSSGPKTGPNSPTAQSANINDLISFETDFDAAIPSTAVAENPSSPSFPPQNPEFPNLLDMDSAVAASKPSSSSSTFPRYQTGQPTKFPSLDSTTNAPSPQSPTATTTTPLLLSYPLMTKAEASAAWAFALEEAEDEIKFPPVRPVVHALYATMEEMLQAQERGVHDPFNPFRRPNGPTRSHVELLQKLYHEEKMPVDQIAGVLVEMYPELCKGTTRGGREKERREMVHGVVSVWVSDWAGRVR